MRCFVAVALPETVRASLEGVQAALRKSFAGARWVRPEGIHLTLRFLGEIDEALVNALGEDLRVLAMRSGPPFSLAVGGVGFFPRRASPRVVWVGLRNPADDPGALARLAALQASIEETARRAGLSPETRAFHPHLTLARLDGRGTPFSDPGNLGEDLGRLPVASVRLMRSVLKPSGAVYDVLQEHPL